MKRLLLAVGILLLAVTASSRSMAANAYGAFVDGLPAGWVEGPACNPWLDYECPPPKLSAKQLKAIEQSPNCDPYLNYKCLDRYLGDDFFTRFIRYYQLEWGKGMAPADPNAPASQRAANAPDALGAANLPEPSPPMPFVAWPYGGTNNIGASLPNAVDSPLMVALANTALGKAMSDAHIQVYGWLDPSANLSTNNVKPAGNLPVSYDYTPNTVQLDQAVLYVERVPDEVQNQHWDWGFRLSALWGVDGRYTMAYGNPFSSQLTNYGQVNIFDTPMMYFDMYFPVLLGLNVRIGRFISIPDIEAQLAPNNYTFVHSLTYTWDNYTNQGIEFTLAMTKNWILQLGSTIGTEAFPWQWQQRIRNMYVLNGLGPGCGCGLAAGVDPLYPGGSILKDPGAVPSITAGIKWTSDDGRDDFNFVVDAWNSGTWGFNNLQWIGFTYYHKWNEYWHFAFETWNIHENNVPNLNNAQANFIQANNGTPFNSFTTPTDLVNAGFCSGPKGYNPQTGSAIITSGAPLTCTTDTQTFLLYVNYSPNKLNNFSLRTEYFNDQNGQRTGIPTAYVEAALSWQHWLSPQIEFRPEIGFYRSIDAPAFDGNSLAPIPIVPSRNWAVIAAADAIIHF